MRGDLGRTMAGMALAAALLLAGTGCQSRAAAKHSPVVARFFLEGTREATATLRLPRSETFIPVQAKAVVVETDIVNVELAQVEMGLCLLFQLSPAAARDLFRLTAANQGRRLVLTLDGAPVGARLLDRPLNDGVIMIFVELPDEALPPLVHDLKATSQQVQRELAQGRRG
jgi:hypothetical protein